MWRSEFRPTSALHRRPRGAVTAGQLWGWIIGLVVLLAVIMGIVWLVLPSDQPPAAQPTAATSDSAPTSDTAQDGAATSDSAGSQTKQ
jgi:hypothetical protein